MPPLSAHTYEEIRTIVVNILLGRENTSYTINQFAHLVEGVKEVFARRIGESQDFRQLRLNIQDEELIRDVFWDLFRQGAITLGNNSSNENWPFFRLSHTGSRTLGNDPSWRFHDTSSFLSLVRTEIPDISDEAIAYLDEAVSAFYAECLLASSVMLGVAAEAEFLRLLEVAAARPSVGSRFRQAANERFIRRKISKFLAALSAISSNLGSRSTEDLETNFAAIQSVLRIARNEAGHPTSARPQREIVYINLQLFVPFARQLMRLREALITYDPDQSHGNSLG